MKKVVLKGPLLSHSGYGIHCRQIARWLFRKAAQEHDLQINTEITPWGNTHWITDIHAEDGLIGEIVSAATAEKQMLYDLSIQVQLPNEWNPNLAKFNVGVTAGVETDICNPGWCFAINQMQLVIVPSEFTKNTFLKSGVITTPIVVIPEAFPDCYLKQELLPKIDLGLPTKYNYLIVGQITGNNLFNDRKNIPFTLRWLADSLAGLEDVGIVLKTNVTGANSVLDKKITTNFLKKMISELSLPANSPPIYLLHGNMTNEEVASLYREPTIKALVTLTRGEGFGLPILEAAASGLPIIATKWSAHTEFLSLGKYISVDYKLERVHDSKIDNNIFIPGASWASADELHAKNRFRKFAVDGDKPRQWAKELQGKIIEKYNFEAIAKQYSNVFDQLLREQEVGE